MPAQDGGNILLAYGPQGSQQTGDDVLLATVVVVTGTRLSATTHGPWGRSALKVAATAAQFGVAGVSDPETSAPWVEGIDLDGRDRASWVPSDEADADRVAPWRKYAGRAQPETDAHWVPAVPADDLNKSPWGKYGGRAQPQQHAAWSKALFADQQRRAPWNSFPGLLRVVRIAPFPNSSPADREEVVPWSKYAKSLTPDWGIVIPVHEGPPEALYVVPIRSFYMVTNTASLRRVEGDVALPTYNMSLNVDVDSWAWSFSATLPSAALADLQPNEDGDPVELEALVNGMAFRVFAEKLTRDRTFRDSRINVGGRGMIAALDAPYAPELSFGNTEDLTLAQLIDQVLTDTGVSLGWDVTFGLEDWLVPGEVFSHRGSYMSAVNRLAQAGGGYVLPHPSDKAFSVLAKYPFAPWEWSTLDPDYELPANIVTREGIEWVDKPRYNRVYVSGVQAGVLGQLTRDGTAGDKIAPMIVDPLVTTAAAARQRGLPALADTGRIANVSLKLPVTADTNGVIQPGALVRYVDGDTTRVGLVRSSSVAVGLPEVWQTIGVETHVEPV